MTTASFQAGTLANRAVLWVSGAEARQFLHNLLTADIDGLAKGRATYAALLTPQGKILSDMFVLDAGDGFVIDCAASQRDELLKRLTFYRLRAKVDIASDDRRVIVSPIAPLTGARYFSDPRTPDLGFRGFSEIAAAPAEDYDAARLTLGLADSVADIGSGELFPHEANLDQLGAVSFTKGCYIGQEVVSRMEHRGSARNRVLPVTLAGAAPARGAEIRCGGKLIGTLMSSSGTRALALLRLDRLAEAREPLLTTDVAVTVHRPKWVRYDVPGAKTQ